MRPAFFKNKPFQNFMVKQQSKYACLKFDYMVLETPVAEESLEIKTLQTHLNYSFRFTHFWSDTGKTKSLKSKVYLTKTTSMQGGS